MREYTMSLFHKVIIASICCGVLFGCGYKADPYWKEKPSQQEKKG